MEFPSLTMFLCGCSCAFHLFAVVLPLKKGDREKDFQMSLKDILFPRLSRAFQGTDKA